ncbi:MAG: methyltransferase domain-containing protein [Bacteroidota bacterium]
MKISSLIGHSTELYNVISKSTFPADLIISRYFRERKYLGSTDRRFISETIYGVLRNKKRLEYLLEQNNYKSENETIYRIIILFLYFSNKNISEEELFQVCSKEEIQSLKILSKVIPTSTSINEKLSLEYSFPEWLIEKFLLQYSENETEQLCQSLNETAPITLRVNTLKTNPEELSKKLLENGIPSSSGKYTNLAVLLNKRINVFSLPFFKDGFFEMQDEGSQIISLLVDPKPSSIVIDACSGSGGKSLAMAAIMKNRGEIFALDINEKRLNDIRLRIKRSGADTIRVRKIIENEIPTDLIEKADYVLIDAPCSGTGTLRRNPGMKWQLQEKSIDELRIKQISILNSYSKLVKIGGKLIYATCSLLKDENDNIIDKFLSENKNYKLIDASLSLSRYGLEKLSKDKYLKMSPHLNGTDGFFGAIMEKIK